MLSQGICKFVGGAKLIQWTFGQLQPHTESSNVLNMLELHTTSSMPNLGTHVHVSCVKKKDFALFGPKIVQLFILACVLQFRMTKFVVAESSTGWQWVN